MIAAMIKIRIPVMKSIMVLTIRIQCMASLSNAVISSLVEDYTRSDLVTLRKAATDAVLANLPRIELTGVNFETGGHSGEFVNGDPVQVAEYCQAAIDRHDEDVMRNESVVFGDFSSRRVGW